MRNQVFLVFDSLRYDVFSIANTPFLDSLGDWKKAFTQGSYTLPAHMSFFVGKLPQTYDGDNYYDTVASRYHPDKGCYRFGEQLWRLEGPEVKRPALHSLSGQDIIVGFRQQGYRTIGTGAVNWFNPELEAGKHLTSSFEHFRFFGHISAEPQLAWATEQVAAAKKESKPYFLFINFGETHHSFKFKGCDWAGEPNPYGDRQKCLAWQQGSIEYLDKQLAQFFANIDVTNCDLVMCADHGEALGEDGLWGHGFSHPSVLEVPLLIRAGTNGNS